MNNSQSAKTKVECIVDLQNEIYDFIQDLKDEYDLDVLRVTVTNEGKMALHIYEENHLAELYPNYNITEEYISSERCSIEIEGVEIFSLKPKPFKEETM